VRADVVERVEPLLGFLGIRVGSWRLKPSSIPSRNFSHDRSSTVR
jgi:hypothetical protein